MPNSVTIPHDDIGKLVLLQYLHTPLPKYAANLQNSTGDLAQRQTGLNEFDCRLKAQSAVQNHTNASKPPPSRRTARQFIRLSQRSNFRWQ